VHVHVLAPIDDTHASGAEHAHDAVAPAEHRPYARVGVRCKGGLIHGGRLGEAVSKTGSTSLAGVRFRVICE
jgi:hypothetical protein